MAYDSDLAEQIRAVVAAEPGVTEKRMFGGLAFLVGGNLAASASSQGGLLLRVDPRRTGELVGRPEAARFVMRGREMDGWLRIDTAGLDEATVREWIAMGVGYARSLPAK